MENFKKIAKNLKEGAEAIQDLVDKNQEIIDAKNDSNNDNLKLIEENEKYKNQCSVLLEENKRLIIENNNLSEKHTAIVEEKNEKLSNFNNNSDNNSITLGIPDLAVKINEAVHDAITYFDKKCPYCNTELFITTNRKQYEIDHFFPVNMGGQDFPWNILPVCQKCNRQKRDKLPNKFLNPETFNIVLDYLSEVHNNYLKDAIDTYLVKSKLTELLEKERDFLIFNLKSEFVSKLLFILNDLSLFKEQQKIIDQIVNINEPKVLLNYILKYEIKLGSTYKLNKIEIGKLINSAITKQYNLSLSKNNTKEILNKYGIKVTEYKGVYLSNSNINLKDIINEAQISEKHQKILLKLPGVVTTNSIRFGSLVNRAIFIPNKYFEQLNHH
jgi:5-methylcytosine-specific restriction endonuclease McrA